MTHWMNAAVIAGPLLGCLLIISLSHFMRRYRWPRRLLPYRGNDSAAAAAMNLRHDLELSIKRPIPSVAEEDEAIYRAYLTASVPMSERRLRKLPLVILAARHLGQRENYRDMSPATIQKICHDARRMATSSDKR